MKVSFALYAALLVPTAMASPTERRGYAQQDATENYAQPANGHGGHPFENSYRPDKAPHYISEHGHGGGQGHGGDRGYDHGQGHRGHKQDHDYGHGHEDHDHDYGHGHGHGHGSGGYPGKLPPLIPTGVLTNLPTLIPTPTPGAPAALGLLLNCKDVSRNCNSQEAKELLTNLVQDTGSALSRIGKLQGQPLCISAIRACVAKHFG